MSTKNSHSPDLLYILGTGSRWQDNEIRYSLRSAEKNLEHGKVFVVGENPGWLQNIRHIGCDDPYGIKKLKNSIYKLATAVRDPKLSGDFILMNDDFFILKPVDQIEPMCKGFLADTMAKHPTKRGYYFDAMMSAFKKLLAYGIEKPKDFSLHQPFLFNRNRVRKTMDIFGGAGHGYLFRTMYGNLWHEDAEQANDRKLTGWSVKTQTSASRLTFLSTDPQVVLDPAFQRWLKGKFPTPSIYERS